MFPQNVGNNCIDVNGVIILSYLWRYAGVPKYRLQKLSTRFWVSIWYRSCSGPKQLWTCRRPSRLL